MKSTYCGVPGYKIGTVLHSAARSGSKAVVEAILIAMDKLNISHEEVQYLSCFVVAVGALWMETSQHCIPP